jgi:hypothetical protein
MATASTSDTSPDQSSPSASFSFPPAEFTDDDLRRRLEELRILLTQISNRWDMRISEWISANQRQLDETVKAHVAKLRQVEANFAPQRRDTAEMVAQAPDAARWVAQFAAADRWAGIREMEATTADMVKAHEKRMEALTARQRAEADAMREAKEKEIRPIREEIAAIEKELARRARAAARPN